MIKMTRVLAFLLFCAILATPLAASAKDEGRVYVIKKGDTLWGLSQRFITDPYYWPNLWAHNPFIGNPHLIYPGQKVRIRDGRLEILPADGQPTSDGAPLADGSLPSLPEPAEEVRISTYPGSEGFIATDDFTFDGRLVDFDSERLLAAEGDLVFADFRDPDEIYAGDEFMIYRIGRMIKHPATGEDFGHLVEELGNLKVKGVHGKVASATITRTAREIERGDVLRPAFPYDYEVVLKEATQELRGMIIAARDIRIEQGQHDLIYVDLGEKDGLQIGNMLNITRPRTATEFAIEEDEELVLPDKLLGAAVVVDVTPRSGVAIIVKSVSEINSGDAVSTVLAAK